MTDVREVELADIVQPVGRNEVAPAQGRDLRTQPGRTRPLAAAARRVRAGIQWRALLTLLICFSPTLICATYFGLIASDRFVSTAAFIVRTASKPAGGASGLGAILRMTGLSRAEDDTYSVQNYMLSRDAVRELEERLPLADMYGRPGSDFLARYPSLLFGSTQEELFRFYTKMTTVTYNATTGVTTMEVQAFRPDDAKAIAVNLLDLGEQLVNRLNSRIQKDAIVSAEDQVKREESRLTDAQVAITAFQNREGMIDPTNNSVMVSTLVGKLEADLAQTLARISDMSAGSPNNPGLAGLQRQAEAIRTQIGRERQRVSSAQEGLADKLGQYQRLALEREFATKALTVANASLDTARAEARRKQLYIERVVEPDQSDHATLPLRGWITLTTLMINVLALFIGWLLFAGVKEHVSSVH